MNKSELRKNYKQRRSQLSETKIDDLSFEISNTLLKLDIWKHSFYHTFLTIEENKEVNTNYLLSILSGKDKNIVISKSDFATGLMTHFLLTDNTTLKKNAFNIPEPTDGIEIDSSKMDVIFIPLLAFDKQGSRVGYGKGFYDKFLSQCKSECVFIGLSYFEPISKIKDLHRADISLHFCVSPMIITQF